jgi:tripartite-type tricarboxylate transporter receptor subunit TctC
MEMTKGRNARYRAVLASALCAVASAPHQAAAQSYPAKPLRIIVPLAPGGGNDTVARLVGQKLSESIGQPVIVENRAGGGGVIASEIVSKAPADGYTLYLVSTSFTAAPALHQKLSFDTLKDFAPITRLSTVPGALTVHTSLPVKTVQQLLALAKARPGEITYGSAGVGSGSHFAGELFKLASRANLLHVPYRGSSLVTTALLSGEVMLSFGNPISAMPHVKAGRLHILAVTSAQRWPLLPQFPSAAEAGVRGYELLIWNGMAVPAGTPQAVLARLHRELTNVMATQEVIDRLSAEGSRPQIERPEEFAAFLKDEIARWQKVVKASGMKHN